ncbi:hypothetical protein E8E11_003577 [Didymella keratinophila]|nr:hypothetical protein E8E11_003577 [Didymella keratinophila]
MSFGLPSVAPRRNNELHVDKRASPSSDMQSPDDMPETLAHGRKSGKRRVMRKRQRQPWSQVAEPQVTVPQEVPQSQALGKMPGKNALRRAKFRAEAEEAGVSMIQYRKQFNTRKEDGQRLARQDEDVEAVKGLCSAEGPDGYVADTDKRDSL